LGRRGNPKTEFESVTKMKVRGLVGAFIFLLILAACTHLQAGTGRVGICYIPVDVVFFVPATRENLDTKCFKVGEVAASNAKVRKILRKVYEAPVGAFNENEVRVKITPPSGKPIYIDSYGGVKISLSSKALSPTQLAEVDRLLFEITENWPTPLRTPCIQVDEFRKERPDALKLVDDELLSELVGRLPTHEWVKTHFKALGLTRRSETVVNPHREIEDQIVIYRGAKDAFSFYVGVKTVPLCTYIRSEAAMNLFSIEKDHWNLTKNVAVPSNTKVLLVTSSDSPMYIMAETSNGAVLELHYNSGPLD